MIGISWGIGGGLQARHLIKQMDWWLEGVKLSTPCHSNTCPITNQTNLPGLQIAFDQKPHECLPSVILDLLDHYNHAFISSIWSW